MTAPGNNPADADAPATPESSDSGSPVVADPEKNASDDYDETSEQPGPDSDFDTDTSIAARSKDLYSRSLENALVAARCADEMRGQDILVLDLTQVTSIVDFFVIVTATSRRQLHAIADEVNRKLKRELGNQRLSIEGYRTEGNWVLTDYGDVVLHVFTPEGRALYALEELWADAPQVDWQNADSPK